MPTSSGASSELRLAEQEPKKEAGVLSAASAGANPPTALLKRHRRRLKLEEDEDDAEEDANAEGRSRFLMGFPNPEVLRLASQIERRFFH